MDIAGIFLWEFNIWIWKMSSCGRANGYGKRLLLGEEDVSMHDAFLYKIYPW